MQVEETIVATASTHDGGGLRGIVRISGPDTVDAVCRLFESADAEFDFRNLRSARRISGTFLARAPVGRLPCDLYLWPTERSYTRQPTAELHTVGAVPLLDAIVETVCQHGARLAEPGEFTLRAFLAGRIDLAQAEAVLGVIDAASDRELNVALTQLAGGLSQPLDRVRDTLLNLCADLEAGLDFVDEDIEFVSSTQVSNELQDAIKTVNVCIERMQTRGGGEQLPRVVLRGEPNTGKSSLWNAMLGDSRAIVTEQAGTTRDYLTGTVAHDDYRFTLIDTAGIEHSEEDLQRAMRDTADNQSTTAELILFCLDGSRPMTAWEQAELAKSVPNRLVVRTKADLELHPSLVSNNGEAMSAEVSSTTKLVLQHVTSAKDPETVHALIMLCGRELEARNTESNVVGSTAVRCRESLRSVHDSLQNALHAVVAEAGDELVAAELRVALDHLGQIVGSIYTDDILDRVFSRFCIGK